MHDERNPPPPEYEPISFGRKELSNFIENVLEEDLSDPWASSDEADMPDNDGTPDRVRMPVGGVRTSESMPQNVEAEAALLGAMMIDNRIAEQFQVQLSADDFFEPIHGEIWTSMLALMGKGIVANPVTLRPMFEHDETMKQLGGPAYLVQLTGNPAAIIGASGFVAQILNLSKRRKLLMALDEANAIILDPKELDAIEDVVADIDRALSETGVQPTTMRTIGIGAAWDEAYERMAAAERGEEQPGILIKQYDDWNAVVGRMSPGDYILLGARPSMGKSGVAFAVAVGAATAGHATELLSLEMSRDPVMNRIIANQIFVPDRTSPYSVLTGGKFTSVDRHAILSMREQMQDLPLHISDPATMYVENLASHIRRRQRYWKARGKELKLCIVDYLGRLQARGKFNSPNDRVTYISNHIKSAAKQTGVPIVALAQLSRGVEQREDKRPVLADLRDSGALEQDADTVVFVYRDEYYLRGHEPPSANREKWEKWDTDMRGARDRLELYSAKRREGALVKRTGWFFTEHQAIRTSGYRYGDDLFTRADQDEALSF